VPSRRRPKPTWEEVVAAVPEAVGSSKGQLTLAAHSGNYQWVPDGSVDLVLTDPPFNIAQDTNFHTYKKNTINSYRFDKDKGWDTYGHAEFIELLSDWATEFARVLRKGGTFAVFCADDYLSHLTEALRGAGLSPRRTLTWRKPNAVPVNRRVGMMSACEYIVVGVKGAKATFNADLNLSEVSDELRLVEQVVVGDKAAAVVEKHVREALASISSTGMSRRDDVKRAVERAVAGAAREAATKAEAMYVEEDGILRACVPNHVAFNAAGGKRLHPTEKPVPLLRYLIGLLSEPGDIVLDPFGGSGSTGEAGAGLGRRVVVVERDEEFFRKLVKRLEELPSNV
jgi:site-specific DNA-methyltransferase (adenine-specific)